MTVSYERRGSGEPLLLIHGLGSRWQVFEPVLDILADRHDVIAVDLPGFGSTPSAPVRAPSAGSYARWVASALLPELGIRRPHIVGNSLGGGIGLELARMNAAATVTCFSPIGFWGRTGQLWCQALLTVLRGAGIYTPRLVDASLRRPWSRTLLLAPLIGRPTRVSLEVARGDTAGLVGATSFEAARNSFTGYRIESNPPMQVPVTIAWGTRDFLLPHRTQARRARDILPRAQHVDLPGCGHLPFSDDPALCAATILERTGNQSR
jgi:pimeloyl-ACP methyl ester carboxylesterase